MNAYSRKEHLHSSRLSFPFINCFQNCSVKAVIGFYSKLDLGIVKYHFEAEAGETGWE